MTDFSSSPYYQTAIDAANTYGVPSGLFTWQIGQESSFNPQAQNGNATGIAQFMPGTAADFNLDPTDPTASLYAAAAYDSQLAASNGGNWITALEKYGTISGNNSGALASQAQTALNGSSTTDSSPTMAQRFSCFGNAISFSDYTACFSSSGNTVNNSTNNSGLNGVVSNSPAIKNAVIIAIGIAVLLAGLFLLKDYAPAAISAPIQNGFNRLRAR